MKIVGDKTFYKLDRLELHQHLQELLRDVKRKIFEARLALESTMIVRQLQDVQGDPFYADRTFSIAEQHLNLALLYLAEGRDRMQEVDR